jgi:hypothetical protein
MVLSIVGKRVGKCIHTNSEMMEQHQHNLLLKLHKKQQEKQEQASMV